MKLYKKKITLNKIIYQQKMKKIKILKMIQQILKYNKLNILKNFKKNHYKKLKIILL